MHFPSTPLTGFRYTVSSYYLKGFVFLCMPDSYHLMIEVYLFYFHNSVQHMKV